MKKLSALVLVFLLLLNLSPALASGLPNIGENGLPNIGSNALPVILAPIPDPAESLGSVGSEYQKNYGYKNETYDLYLYSRPDPADDFIAAYTQAAQDAGYQVTSGTEDTYKALFVTSGGMTAILMYDYQGYMLFMVPVDADFTLLTAVAPTPAPKIKLNMSFDLNGIHYESNPSYGAAGFSSILKSYSMLYSFKYAPFSSVFMQIPVDAKAGTVYTITKKQGTGGSFTGGAGPSIYFDLVDMNELIYDGSFCGFINYSYSTNSDYFKLSITKAEESEEYGYIIEGTFECKMRSGTEKESDKIEIKNGRFAMVVDR